MCKANHMKYFNWNRRYTIELLLWNMLNHDLSQNLYLFGISSLLTKKKKKNQLKHIYSFISWTPITSCQLKARLLPPRLVQNTWIPWTCIPMEGKNTMLGYPCKTRIKWNTAKSGTNIVMYLTRNLIQFKTHKPKRRIKTQKSSY